MLATVKGSPQSASCTSSQNVTSKLEPSCPDSDADVAAGGRNKMETTKLCFDKQRKEKETSEESCIRMGGGDMWGEEMGGVGWVEAASDAQSTRD